MQVEVFARLYPIPFLYRYHTSLSQKKLISIFSLQNLPIKHMVNKKLSRY